MGKLYGGNKQNEQLKNNNDSISQTKKLRKERGTGMREN